MTLNMVAEQLATTTPLVTRRATTQEPTKRVQRLLPSTPRHLFSHLAEEDAATVEEDADGIDKDNIVDTATAATASS